MKRFIAGAECPACKNTDTLFFESPNQDEIHCCECGYQASREKSFAAEDDSQKDNQEEKQIKWH